MKDITKANEKVTITLEITNSQAETLIKAIDFYIADCIVTANKSLDKAYRQGFAVPINECEEIENQIKKQLKQREVVSIEN